MKIIIAIQTYEWCIMKRGMLLLLFAFSTLSIFLANIHNVGKEAYLLIAVSILQYGIYFFILKKIFSSAKTPVFIITIAALISFVTFLYATPKLSNDVYRYLWDGLVQKEGYNPYLYVPGDWKFHDLQESNMTLFAHVDWRDKFTPYPPVAQFIFVNAHALFVKWGLIAGKLLFALPVILSAVLIYMTMGKKIYAAFILNPLLLLELVANAHLDGWVLFLMLIGLLLYRKQSYIPATFIWTLAIATKIYPIIFVPFFVIDLLRKRKFTEVVFSTILGSVVLYILYRPFIAESLFPLTHYLTLPNEQEYNASLYRYLYLFLGMEKEGVMLLASKISTVIFGITAGILLLKKYSYELLLFVGLLYLICSPIVFPWYILFLIPFIIFQVSETSSPRLMFFFAFMECLATLIYFEPGIWIIREIMLDFEYSLLLITILLYKWRIPKITLPGKEMSLAKSKMKLFS